VLGPARKPLREVCGRYIPIVGVPLADSLVGRDLELQLIRGMVRDVRAGQAEVLLIEGEAGIGKSRLVQSLIAEAYAAGGSCSAARPIRSSGRTRSAWSPMPWTCGGVRLMRGGQ